MYTKPIIKVYTRKVQESHNKYKYMQLIKVSTWPVAEGMLSTAIMSPFFF